MNKKVEIYSRSNCTYCVMATNFFDSKGISYTVYSADDPKIFKEMRSGLSVNFLVMFSFFSWLHKFFEMKQ